MVDSPNELSRVDIVESLKPIIADRIAWEKITTRELIGLKLDQEHHDKRIEKLEENLEVLPQLANDIRMVRNTINGSPHDSEIGVKTRLLHLEKNTITYDGMKYLITVVVSSVAAAFGAFGFLLHYLGR